MPKRLTDKAVERMAPKGRDTWIFDAAVPGLVLKVTIRGSKIWALWTKYPGSKNQTARTLGVWTPEGVTVAAARKKAEAWRALVAQDIDPSEIERKERQAAEAARRAEMLSRDHTFARYAEAYGAARTNRRAKEDAKEIQRLLIPLLGPLPLAEISPRHVREAMAKLLARSPYAAKSGWDHLSGIFKSAVHEEAIPVSPLASLDKRLIFKNAKMAPRQRVLSDAEVFALWRGAGRLGYPFTPFYRLLLLTGCRLSEIAEARWTELHPELRRRIREARGQPIDWSAVPDDVKVLTIPRERFKSDADHIVHLSSDALTIIAELPRFAGCDFMFSTGGKAPAWVNSKIKRKLDRFMLRTLKAMARRRGDDPAQVTLVHWVQHDLRRVVRSNLSALDVPDHISERVLGHGPQGLQRVYDRHRYEKQIREALERWAAKLRNIIEPTEPTPSNVIPMRIG
jgi:integrase